MVRFLAAIGTVFLGFLAATGRLVVFAGLALMTAFPPPFYVRTILREMVNIGYFSLPVVGLTAIFTGMVLALQSYTGFSRFAAEGAVATVVVLSVTEYERLTRKADARPSFVEHLLAFPQGDGDFKIPRAKLKLRNVKF